MTLESIYYIGQTVAVLAILASLVALYFQQRQGQVIARASSQRELLKSASEFLLLTFDNPKVLKDVRHGLMEFDSAPHETKSNFGNWAWVFLVIMEQCVYMKRDELITASSYNGFELGALGIITTPGGAQWWAHTRKVMGVDLVARLDQRLTELGGVTPPIYEFMPQFAPVENSKL
ncbi:MAG: hypothetical protein COA85_01725 [Robiginitomaculum sp.]|nr:MAG: hypothetical protein COA85_01725 [Robiginitomaculum sp.]